MKLDKLVKSLMASASLAALIAATPLAFSFDQHDGLVLKAAYAFADDDGDEGDDGNSGSGSDDDDENQDEGDENDDESDDENDDNNDDENDDNNGDENGDDGENETDGGGGDASDGDNSSEFSLPDGTKVEISADGLNIEIRFPDGTKEEIRNGQYQRKDANNTTVEERAATDEDRARLQALIAG